MSNKHKIVSICATNNVFQYSYTISSASSYVTPCFIFSHLRGTRV